MTAATLVLGSTFSSLHDLFHSTAIVVARDVVVLLAVVFWLGLAYWVNKDARHRIGDPWLVGLATLLGLALPYLGPLVYLLLRPVETLGEVEARTAELQMLERHLAGPRSACPGCGAPAEPDYLVCPMCARRLRQACRGCEAPLEPQWRTCPYCAEPARPAAEPGAAVGANGRAALREAGTT